MSNVLKVYSHGTSYGIEGNTLLLMMVYTKEKEKRKTVFREDYRQGLCCPSTQSAQCLQLQGTVLLGREHLLTALRDEFQE